MRMLRITPATMAIFALKYIDSGVGRPIQTIFSVPTAASIERRNRDGTFNSSKVSSGRVGAAGFLAGCGAGAVLAGLGAGRGGAPSEGTAPATAALPGTFIA